MGRGGVEGIGEGRVVVCCLEGMRSVVSSLCSRMWLWGPGHRLSPQEPSWSEEGGVR